MADSFYRYVVWIAAGILSITSIVCLIRVILGPRFTDRIVAGNVINTKAIILIALLSFLFGKSFLLDIAIVYAMISFLAVVVLSKCYIKPGHVDPTEPAHRIHDQREESE